MHAEKLLEAIMPCCQRRISGRQQKLQTIIQFDTEDWTIKRKNNTSITLSSANALCHFIYTRIIISACLIICGYIAHVSKAGGEQNAVDYCGNDGNFLPYIVIFILFTVHYYFDTWIQMLIKSCVNYYFSLSFLREKNTKEIRGHVSSLSTIQSNNKLNFLLIWKNAVETAKIAVDSCYVLRQFLTPLPSIDFREIRGLV